MFKEISKYKHLNAFFDNSCGQSYQKKNKPANASPLTHIRLAMRAKGNAQYIKN